MVATLAFSNISIAVIFIIYNQFITERCNPSNGCSFRLHLSRKKLQP